MLTQPGHRSELCQRSQRPLTFFKGRGAIIHAVLIAATCLSTASLAKKPKSDKYRPTLVYQNVVLPDRHVMRLAIAEPLTRSPQPTILILHGTHGFAEEYLQLAQDFAAHGYVGVAACWFAPGTGSGMQFIKSAACPDNTPMLAEAGSAEAQQRLATLLAAVRKLPSVDTENVFIMGHSRGGGVALNYVLDGGKVRGAILNSAGFPGTHLERIPNVVSPILIVHGEKDSTADGGSEVTAVSMARAFTAAALKSGKNVRVRIYKNGGHNSFFSDQKQRKSTVMQIERFINAVSVR